MGTKKIEFLADHRSAARATERSQRVLRHLDAARAKLDALQAARRQLKLAYQKCLVERDAALARAEELELRHVRLANELQAAQILLEFQSAQIERSQDSRRARPPRKDDGPALTVLAIEKTAARAKAEPHVPVTEPRPPEGFIDRIRRRIRGVRPSTG